MAEPVRPEPSPDLPPENPGDQPPGPPAREGRARPGPAEPPGPAERSASAERSGRGGEFGGPGDRLGVPGGPDRLDGSEPGATGGAGEAAGSGASGDETERAFLEIVAHFADRPAEATWPPAEDLQLPPHPPVVVVRPARSPRPPGDPDEPTETDLRVIGGPDDGADDPPVERPAAGTDPGIDQQTALGTAFGVGLEPGLGAGLGADAVGNEHYEPPPAPPAPRLRPGTRAALACVALGVVLLVAPALTTAIDPTLTWETVAVLLVLGGVGTLVARMRDHRDLDPGDGPDDGAVV
ncbi:MAG: hypothetical protein ACQSGP_11205 [Frankia sp.]